MNIVSSVKSILGGSPKEVFGEGQRFPLTKDMVKTIRTHISSLQGADLSRYTFEKARSDRRDAKSDLIIYDDHHAAVLWGRESRERPPLSFWTK